MTVIYLLSLVLFLVGLFGLLTQKNLIKIIVSVAIIESAVNVFLVLLGYRRAGIAPIVTARQTDPSGFLSRAVDPFPQAMVLTSLVIGLSILALMIGISLRLHRIYGTYDIREIRAARKEGKR